MKTIRVKIPDRIHRQIEVLVKEGWFLSQEEIINQAIRKFVEANRPEMLEKYFRDDVEWGLRGGR